MKIDTLIDTLCPACENSPRKRGYLCKGCNQLFISYDTVVGIRMLFDTWKRFYTEIERLTAPPEWKR